MATSPNGVNDKQKEKDRKLKEKEKEIAAKEKEKEKARKEKEKEKEKAQKLKEKEREKKEKEREKGIQKLKEKKESEKKAPKPLKKEEDDEEGDKVSKKRKIKKEKPEGFPRRPLNAPMMYVSEARPAFVKKNPTLKTTDVAKQLHAAYKTLPQDQRKRYEDRYALAKAKYAKEMTAFKAANPKVPKRPLGAYTLFVKSEIQKEIKANPGAKVTELMTKLGAKWNGLTPEQKKPYEKQAAQKKIEFEKQYPKTE